MGYVLEEEMSRVQPPLAPRPDADLLPAGESREAPHPPAAGDVGGATVPIDELRAALERNPNDTAALLALANLNFDIQRWARAEELYRRYLALRPEDPDARTDLGVVLRAQGRIEEALQEFRAAQQVDPRHWQARFNEVLVLGFDQGRLEAAQERWLELRNLAPDEPAVERLGEELRTRRPVQR